jgi:hypothetical protein
MSAYRSHLRRAILSPLVCVVFGCASEPDVGSPFIPPDEMPMTQPKPARPCLLDGVDCLALDERPFKPCLLSVDRCPSEAQVEPASASRARD